MESRRLVVWISAGILGFQGATLAIDLLNCTVLSWLFVRQHGLGVELVRPGHGLPGPGVEQAAAEGVKPGGGASGLASSSPAAGTSQADPQPSLVIDDPAPPNPAPPPVVGAFDPTGVFCAQPRSRIDDAVSQGLTILAGLALGSSVGGGGRSGGGGP